MLFRESVKKFKAYNAGDIVGLHKYAFYGDLEKFEKLITKDLIKQYTDSMYYCIDYGCKRNFEFAEYILKNIEFVDISYKMSITATYIRNGKYDSDLYVDKFNYSLYKNISKKDVELLVKYENLHNILHFISVLNSFELSVSSIYLHPINRLKFFYNLPNNKHSKKLTDHSNFVILGQKYTKEDLDPYSFSVPPGDYENICNIEREFLKIYLINGHKENKVLKPLNDINIMNDVRFAIEAYSRSILIDWCLSKFILIAPKLSLDLIKKHKPFLVLGNARFNFEYLDKYTEINPLYRHNFIYSAIMYHSSGVENYIGDEIDYCHIEACIKSCNFTILKVLKAFNKKCYKRLDYINNKYLKSDEIIDVDYEKIESQLKFDVAAYKFL